jgi:hypothetical protein
MIAAGPPESSRNSRRGAGPARQAQQGREDLGTHGAAVSFRQLNREMD